MKSDTSRFSTPDLDARNSGTSQFLCIVLSIVCVALIVACVCLAHSLHVEQTHLEALELSGENVIRRATEILSEIDAKNMEELKSHGGGLYFEYTNLFDQYVEQTWDYTIASISGDDN